MILNETEDNNYLESIRNGTLKQGLGIGCDLDKFYLYKENNFDVWAGHANVGKTDWLIWWRVCLSVKHSLSWLIYSSENRTGSLKRKIIEYSTGIRMEDLTEEQFNKANTWMNFKFKFVNTNHLYTARDLIKVFEDNQEVYDGVLLDPYNSLKRESFNNGHEYDYEIASEFRLFCKNYNKNLCIAAHGVTEALRKVHEKNHRFGGMPRPLMAADIEGGGKWVNRADNFGVLHRYTQSKDAWFITEVHVRKIKETETGGKPTFLDEPVQCKKAYQTFEIGGKNPLPTSNGLNGKAIEHARETLKEEEWRNKDKDELDIL